jgi:hypothetical protein
MGIMNNSSNKSMFLAHPKTLDLQERKGGENI